MSYANGTTHYNLPQTVGTDKRDWADPNQAFADIDAAIYGAVQDTAQAALDIDALETRMDTAEQGISTNAGNIAGLDTRLTTAEGAITSQGAQITDTRRDLEDMICAYNEASATSTHAYAIGDYFIYNDVLYRAIQAIAIGDTIVPDTNCTTTNVSAELKTIKRTLVATSTAGGVIPFNVALSNLMLGLIVNNSNYELEFITGNISGRYVCSQADLSSNKLLFTRSYVSDIGSGSLLCHTETLACAYNDSSFNSSEYVIASDLTATFAKAEQGSTIPSDSWTFNLYTF